VGSHSPRCEVRVLLPDREEVLLPAGTSLGHRLPQSPHYRDKNLVVTAVPHRNVEPHAFRWRLALVYARFMRSKNRLKPCNLSHCAPLTSKTGHLDLDDFPRLDEIARANDVAKIIMDLVPGANISISDVSTPLDDMEASFRGILSITNAREQPGWTPKFTPLREGIAEYISRYREFLAEG
jgi:hypothetical protein